MGIIVYIVYVCVFRPQRSVNQRFARKQYIVYIVPKKFFTFSLNISYLCVFH